MQELEADYVIVGSGAVGMAFADVLVAESDASIIIIDRYAKPGGTGTLPTPSSLCTSLRRTTASAPPSSVAVAWSRAA